LEKSSFIRACRDGGFAIEQALRELDRSFYAILFRDGLRTLGDRDAARDLVQDTFIKVWRRCATFRGDSELLPWIRSILRHGALASLRRPVREIALDADDTITADTSRRLWELSVEGNPSPEQLAHQNEQAVHFQRGWRRFQQEDPLHASVMTWIVEDGLSTEDIAQLLDRTPGATREFISQCRKHARRYLKDWYALATDLGGSP
jgi:RNA polymerase sigma-70 factor (ECF subfamily)